MTSDNNPEMVAELDRLDEAVKAAPAGDVPMPGAIDYVASFGEAGVVGVTLDHPRLGHYIPLANLGLLKGWIEGAAR